eukprot:TRINITY_DN6353_c0_g1_i1.p2 TRINITY_DN6353_c0_g1~~TRINITY_DN6353_c0_g1_i1.p2  ORF type:complete len:141 (-),score=21.72 TRINITY_DN6353_c0_g1_i1:50-472(-)
MCIRDSFIALIHQVDTNQYEHIYLETNKAYNLRSSSASFVKDYVVIKLVKSQQGYWEKEVFQQKDLSQSEIENLQKQEPSYQQEILQEEEAQNGEEQVESTKNSEISQNEQINIVIENVEKSKLNFVSFAGKFDFLNEID